MDRDINGFRVGHDVKWKRGGKYEFGKVTEVKDVTLVINDISILPVNVCKKVN